MSGSKIVAKLMNFNLIFKPFPIEDADPTLYG